jgi:hypothetical protein
MTDNFDSQEAFDLWKSQTTRGTFMPVEVMKRRAEESKKRSQRQRTICKVCAVINVAAAIAGLMFNNHPIEFWLRIVQLTTLAIMLMQLPGLYSQSRFSQNFLSLGLTVKSEPCMEFYRRELMAQRDFMQGICRAMIFAGLQGLVLVAFGIQRPVLIPVGAVLTLAAVIWYMRTARQSSQIQAEIDDLRAFTQSLTT